MMKATIEKPQAQRRCRGGGGFTLVEMLVVITVIMILAGLAVAVFRTSSADTMRSAARIGQSAFLGAKDRALHAKDLRGVRLTRDLTDATMANGFVYLQPLPMLTYPAGSFRLDRLDVNPHDNVPDSADIMIVRGNSAPATPTVDWDTKTQFFTNPGKIRIPKDSGQWYTFTWSTSGSYPLSAANEVLQLMTPFAQQPSDPLYAFPASMTGWLPSSTFSSCDIQLGNDVLPFHQPISLPSGIVIDLKNSSRNVQSLAGIGTGQNFNIDIMFSPRGAVSGSLSALGPLHFLMRDLRDCTAGIDPTSVAQSQTARGDILVLTVFPQTGLVQVFEVDPTDKDGDGVTDDLFAFAKSGKSAGR